MSARARLQLLLAILERACRKLFALTYQKLPVGNRPEATQESVRRDLIADVNVLLWIVRRSASSWRLVRPAVGVSHEPSPLASIDDVDIRVAPLERTRSVGLTQFAAGSRSEDFTAHHDTDITRDRGAFDRPLKCLGIDLSASHHRDNRSRVRIRFLGALILRSAEVRGARPSKSPFTTISFCRASKAVNDAASLCGYRVQARFATRQTSQMQSDAAGWSSQSVVVAHRPREGQLW